MSALMQLEMSGVQIQFLYLAISKPTMETQQRESLHHFVLSETLRKRQPLSGEASGSKQVFHTQTAVQASLSHTDRGPSKSFTHRPWSKQVFHTQTAVQASLSHTDRGPNKSFTHRPWSKQVFHTQTMVQASLSHTDPAYTLPLKQRDGLNKIL